MKISFYRDSFFLIFYSDFGVGQVEYYSPKSISGVPRENEQIHKDFFSELERS
ncbi:hypothetical protein [Leptospira santarosai]|uniref:hypothetical protein n=1 Tax=Leptospira santarosai TaxID=28183 RepID=UPI001F18D122